MELPGFGGIAFEKLRQDPVKIDATGVQSGGREERRRGAKVDGKV